MMSSAQSTETDDLDELAELGVEEVVFRPLFSGPRRPGRTAHRPAADDPNRSACGMAVDAERGSAQDARRVGARRLCRHQSCFGDSPDGRPRTVEECPLCGAEAVELCRHLPRCPRRNEVP